jgi:NAD(P)-dependent dehydrogenase (short-subunit alcohol dehydrogenase family)
VIATAGQLSELDGLPSGSDLYRKALDPNRPATLKDTLLGCSDLPLVALINISEHGLVCPLDAFLPEALRTAFESHVVGPQTLTQAFLPLLRQNAKYGEGRIIQVLSFLGRVTLAHHGPYSAAEHALVALTETLRLEVGPAIQVLVVEHGTLLAPMTLRLDPSPVGLPDLVLGHEVEHIKTNPSSCGPQLDLSQDLQVCCTQIVSALNAKRPPSRISVGLDARWVANYQGLLPSWLWGWLWRRRCRREGR